MNKNLNFYSYVINIHNFSHKPACDLHTSAKNYVVLPHGF